MIKYFNAFIHCKLASEKNHRTSPEAKQDAMHSGCCKNWISWVKVEIGVGKGKTHSDQRQDLKKKVEMREAQREMSRFNRR